MHDYVFCTLLTSVRLNLLLPENLKGLKKSDYVISQQLKSNHSNIMEQSPNKAIVGSVLHH